MIRRHHVVNDSEQISIMHVHKTNMSLEQNTTNIKTSVVSAQRAQARAITCFLQEKHVAKFQTVSWCVHRSRCFHVSPTRVVRIPGTCLCTSDFVNCICLLKYSGHGRTHPGGVAGLQPPPPTNRNLKKYMFF